MKARHGFTPIRTDSNPFVFNVEEGGGEENLI